MAKKRKIKSSVSATASAKENFKNKKIKYSLLPTRKKNRTAKQKYIDPKGRIVTWTGYRLNCEHNRRRNDCIECTGGIPCEKCDKTFGRRKAYEKHLLSERHLLSKEALRIKCSERSKKNKEISDTTEKYIDDILKENKEVEFIERWDHTGNKFDTIYKLSHENCYRGLQTKTLGHQKHHKNTYQFNKVSSYDDDTLIVAINIEDQVYVLLSYDSIKHLGDTATFTFTGCHDKYMYKNKQDFTKAFFEAIKNSTIILDNDITNYFSKDAKMEYASFQKLEELCIKNGLKFERDLKSGDRTDCYINGKPIECKSSDDISKDLFHFHLDKYGGKNVRIPYNENDKIDFFIFNCISPEFKNDFYIIPKFVLVNNGYLTSNSNEGKNNISIVPFNYKRSHWSLEFLNKFEFLKEDKLDPHLGKSSLEKACIMHNLTYDKDFEASRTWKTLSSIQNKKIHYVSTSSDSNSDDLYQISFRKTLSIKDCEDKVQQFEPFDKEDDIDVFILILHSFENHFCIIPKSVLIKKGHIKTTENLKPVKTVRVISPVSKKEHWTKKYWNNYSCFTKNKSLKSDKKENFNLDL